MLLDDLKDPVVACPCPWGRHDRFRFVVALLADGSSLPGRDSLHAPVADVVRAGMEVMPRRGLALEPAARAPAGARPFKGRVNRAGPGRSSGDRIECSVPRLRSSALVHLCAWRSFHT
jgi:hypothetical protein